MKIGKVLFLLGLILIIYAVVSGFYFHFTISDGDYNYSNGYTFKVGTILIGVILMFLGKRVGK